MCLRGLVACKQCWFAQIVEVKGRGIGSEEESLWCECVEEGGKVGFAVTIVWDEDLGGYDAGGGGAGFDEGVRAC